MNRPVLNYVELPATDMPATQTFYTEVFGWSWTQYGPTYSSAVAAGVEVALTTSATPMTRPPVDDQSSNGPLVLFQTDDLDTSLAAVTAGGGDVVLPPFDYPGGSRFHFTDPSGNVLGIYRSNPD